MKVLVLCYEYPPVGGGGGRVAAKVAEGLAARGHDVRVVTAGLRHLRERETIGGVDVRRPRSFRRREDTCSVFEMALYLLTALFPAWALCRSWKPDVLHAHFVVPTGALAWALHRLTGIPYVLTAHLGDVPGGVPEQTGRLFRILGPLIRPIWSGATAITAVSSFVADLARAACGRKVVTILNGIDLTGSPPCLIEQSPPRILMLGRLSIQKDPVLAIRALAEIKDLPWHVEIIGDGPLRAETEEAVRTFGLSSRVTFAGWLGAEAVGGRLDQSGILLMTSRQEGLPVAAIEALQHGLAIVGSRIGGLCDVIADGENGFFCERTPEAFAARLRELLEDSGQRRRFREASVRLAQKFALPERLSDYERVLESV